MNAHILSGFGAPMQRYIIESPRLDGVQIADSYRVGVFSLSSQGEMFSEELWNLAQISFLYSGTKCGQLLTGRARR